ncbi:MAG: hemerythrin domain-containing protein [Actinobacteria bacterium]|nr:hemerythrin domain-containing protein [Actinomycetota bacterium]
MSDLIRRLESEHASLVDSFNKIKRLEINSDGAPVLLQSIKTALLAHLKKENETIYPKLREESFNNPRLQQTLDLFARDIVRLATVFIEFLDKYSQGGSQSDYAGDISRLAIIMSAFARREEDVIFSAYKDFTIGRAA